jgi:hypothetical protein
MYVEVPVVVYVDGEVVGEGTVGYLDISAPSMRPRVTYHCTPIRLFIGEEEASGEVCRYDVVSSGIGGTEEVGVVLPVIVGNTTVGYAELRLRERYGAVRGAVVTATTVGVFTSALVLRTITR